MSDDKTRAEYDRELVRVMTMAAERVMSGQESVYDIANEACAELTEVDLFTGATHSGAAYVFWGEVSDLFDAPNTPPSERDREANMNRFARQWSGDWLSLDHESRAEVKAFFKRLDQDYRAARRRHPGPVARWIRRRR